MNDYVSDRALIDLNGLDLEQLLTDEADKLVASALDHILTSGNISASTNFSAVI